MPNGRPRLPTLSRRGFIGGLLAAAALPAVGVPSIGRAASGLPRTLASFGWNATQTPAAQRAAVQTAFDSGEPLFWPVGTSDTVSTDGPAELKWGQKISGGGAFSRWRTADITQDALHILCDKGPVEDIHFVKDSAGPGCAIVIGPNQQNYHAIYNQLRGVHTSLGFRRGVAFKACGGTQIFGGQLAGHEAGLFGENTISADAGDHEVFGTHFNAGPEGAGIKVVSGGGLYLNAIKGGAGKHHIKWDWHGGGSGNLVVTGGALETCDDISVDLNISTGFERVIFDSVSWGVPSVAVAVRNFYPTGTLKQLTMTGCGISSFAGSNPIVDIGCVDGFMIANNSFRGGGSNQCAVIARPQASNGIIGPNIVQGCATDYITNGTNVYILRP